MPTSESPYTLLQGDCRELMAAMDEESVNCVVTSPPYWSLRKYDCEPSIWGGDANCPHTLEAQPVGGESYAGKQRWQHEGVSRQEKPEAWLKSTIDHQPHGDDGHSKGSLEDGTATQAATRGAITTSATCSRCGAWRGQYGLEPTPQIYVEHTVEVLRAIRRVLTKDGTVWWNIGDGYAGSWGNQGRKTERGQQRPIHGPMMQEVQDGRYPAIVSGTGTPPPGLKPKDLVLMPFRVALAAQEDGWWVRSVIIWHKPNAMPESVRDRPTESHEYILLLTKSDRYWWDQDAVREPHTGYFRAQADEYDEYSPPGQAPQSGLHRCDPKGRNLRTVWTFPTQPYPGAHFAVFPMELPTRCIRAGCPPDGFVLDPFCGTGTTLEAAVREGRRGVGIELSVDYVRQAERRLAEVQMGGLL